MKEKGQQAGELDTGKFPKGTLPAWSSPHGNDRAACILFSVLMGPPDCHCLTYVWSLQSCPTLCNPMDCRRPGPVHGDSPGEILEWVAMPSSRGSSPPRDWTRVSCGSCIAGRFFTTELPGKPDLYSHHYLEKSIILFHVIDYTIALACKTLPLSYFFQLS